MSEAFTLPSDAMAMQRIKNAYNLTKTSWQGDPCAPIGYTWDRVGCTSVNNTLRVTSIDLSYSRLTGEISSNFSILDELIFLDLSYNSLSGPIPDFLGSLMSLRFLNLSGNCFSGKIPNNLVGNGVVTLRHKEYNACKNYGSSKSNHTLIIVIPSVVVATLLIVFFIWRKPRKPQGSTTVQAIPMTPPFQDYSLINNKRPEDELQLSEMRKFSYKELEKMTYNFARFIGKGGFGPVFHGYLPDKKEIAVKMQDSSSNHGIGQFITEVVFLAKVHHRYLVQLVGYCMEETHLGLVYEYMPQGCITDHLRGKSASRILSWKQRLQIALDVAQGLDYLHTGCEAPIIHRDVKCSNILLDNNLRAKLADFGLSKAFEDNNQTHMSTIPAGTLGYMDIEYYKTGRLTEKSDVYSLGVVLLELVTGDPPIDPDKGHITRRVNEMLTQGDINSITDNKLRENYEINSVWKVVDIAMQCTANSSKNRPTMREVVTQLKDSLLLENARENHTNTYCSTSSTGTGTGTDPYSFSASVTMSEDFGPAPR